MSATLPRVGVLGVGSLGAAIAARLAAQGYEVHAHDLSLARIDALAAHGVRGASSPRTLAAATDVVIVLLPDTPEILACLDGADGLEAGLRRGATVVIASTVMPDTPPLLATRLAPRGVAVLDAPVSGGPVVARQGELTIMVGAGAADYAATEPLLSAYGRPVHVGPVGHGEIAKLANNLMGAVIVLGIAEGLALAAKAGADLDRVREAVSGGSGASWILSDWMPRTVLSGHIDAHFAVGLMAKDTRLIGEYAAQLGVPLEAGRLAQATFEEVRDAGYGDKDFSVLVALRAAAAGAPLAGIAL
ncbi:MAG: NAD(P)-dependent oxidoreductase [Conexibacter sp.]|jgi:3-hydroxyisobutyrate dehydrogenase-like beta-hydroxyacid dehydrogenase|nr:NAD(P)-dependent oxidoreductase [Conexibacter sp.]